jgi:hypothetical protein
MATIFPQIEDGTTIILTKKTNYTTIHECCECSALHIMEFSIVGDAIHAKVSRIHLEDIKDLYEVVESEIIRPNGEMVTINAGQSRKLEE